jgi:hypothetical protein
MPLTSNPAKLSETIQCVVRTVAECRGANRAPDSRTATPRKSADSAMTSAADDSTRLRPQQRWDGGCFVISPKRGNERYPIGNLSGKRCSSHRSVERYTLDL